MRTLFRTTASLSFLSGRLFFLPFPSHFFVFVCLDLCVEGVGAAAASGLAFCCLFFDLFRGVFN
jgi:hypothetical protein